MLCFLEGDLVLQVFPSSSRENRHCLEMWTLGALLKGPLQMALGSACRGIE